MATATIAAAVPSATLRLVHGTDMPVLKASMSPDASRADFAKVTAHAFDVISKLTGHPCLSGRFRFEFEDMVIDRAMKVDLQADRLIAG
jgi:hypothetical protein